MQKRSPEHWLAKENAEINEDYNEAVYKIGKTSLPQDAKDLLLSQAQANKELALKQAKEKSDLMMKNMEAREKFRDQIMQEKETARPSARLRIFFKKPVFGPGYRLLA